MTFVRRAFNLFKVLMFLMEGMVEKECMAEEESNLVQ